MKHNKVRHVSTINISKVQMMRIWWIINLGNSVKAPQLVDGVSAQLASTPTLFKKKLSSGQGAWEPPEHGPRTEDLSSRPPPNPAHRGEGRG